jgi:hypothetical protein
MNKTITRSPTLPRKPIAALALSACFAATWSTTPAVVAQSTQAEAGKPKIVGIPPGLRRPAWLQERLVAQRQGADNVAPFHNFQFTDRRSESGIEFMHRTVDDAGKTLKGTHYDHGNSISIADVDGDGFHDIYFVNQVGSNELWRNKGDGTFENITQPAIGLGDRIGVAASFADIDNDGDPDLYTTAVRLGNLLFENDGKGNFADITEKSGLGHKGHSSAAVFFDYNRDGLLDLFLCNVGRYTSDTVRTVINDATTAGLADAFSGQLYPDRYERSNLYKNLGDNRFIDVSREVGLLDVGWTGDASPIDANNDGWPDLYVLNMQGHDHYYENVEGKSFRPKGRQVFPKTPWGSMGIKVFDFDQNGAMDVYITDMHSDMSQNIDPPLETQKSDMKWPEDFLRSGGLSIFGNAFFKKTGADSFEEISDQIGAENYWPWGLSVADINADGYDDALLTSSMNYPYRYGINSMLLNDTGRRLVPAEFILGLEARTDWRVAKPWFMVDCLGADKGHQVCQLVEKDNQEMGVFEVWGAVGTRSSVIHDFDHDGDLDIVTNDFNSEPLVMVSNLSDEKQIRYLKVQLEGKKSNRSGFGARVSVKTASATHTQIQDGKTGYLSQSVAPLYFGLGSAAAIESVEVHWPSGTEQIVPGPIKSNDLLVITED